MPVSLSLLPLVLCPSNQDLDIIHSELRAKDIERLEGEQQQ